MSETLTRISAVSGGTVVAPDPVDAVRAFSPSTDINALAVALEATGALFYAPALLSARPAFGNAGTFFYATDTPTVLYYDTGTAWVTVGASAPVDGSVSTPSLRTLGSGALQAAPGNHGHGVADIVGLADALADIETAVMMGVW